MPGTPFSWAGFAAGENITHSKFQEIVNNLNTERARRGKGAIGAVSAVGNQINASEINYIKTYISDCVATSWPQPTGSGDLISYASILQLQTAINNIRALCLCQCQYACTCQCQYACTCNCQYACTCQCQYGCTCNCNYSSYVTSECSTLRLPCPQFSQWQMGYKYPQLVNTCVCYGHTSTHCTGHTTSHCPNHTPYICPSHVGTCSVHQG